MARRLPPGAPWRPRNVVRMQGQRGEKWLLPAGAVWTSAVCQSIFISTRNLFTVYQLGCISSGSKSDKMTWKHLKSVPSLQFMRGKASRGDNLLFGCTQVHPVSFRIITNTLGESTIQTPVLGYAKCRPRSGSCGGRRSAWFLFASQYTASSRADYPWSQ